MSSYRKNKSWRTVTLSLDLAELVDLDEKLQEKLVPGDDLVDVKIIPTQYSWVVVAFIAEGHNNDRTTTS